MPAAALWGATAVAEAVDSAIFTIVLPLPVAVLDLAIIVAALEWIPMPLRQGEKPCTWRIWVG